MDGLVANNLQQASSSNSDQHVSLDHNEGDHIVQEHANMEQQQSNDNDAMDVDNENYGVGIVRTSPRSGKKSYIPDVHISTKPHLGMKFKTIDDAYSFYTAYARSAGFSVRKHTEKSPYGIVTLKWYVCSKEGFKNYRKVNTLEGFDESQSRSRASIRTGCHASMKVQICDANIYKVYAFREEHNHPLVHESDYHLLPVARKLTLGQKEFIVNLSKLNIGPVKAFSIMRKNLGGFEQVGATVVDFKNFKRDINVYIGKYDCEMVVRRLLRKKNYLQDFSCDFLTDNKGALVGLFWADQEMKQSYKSFGDVISFDSTFRTNKYDLVFVPFTGIDNHHRNICLGAAMLGSETSESYCWLLNAFKKAHGKDPRVVVTDQDLAMKKAIKEVWPLIRHRFCMWHIMKKLAVKVGKTLKANISFKKRICNIVWTDSIEPCEFESKWKEIISDFNLGGNKWLTDIYDFRADWIPAYYRNESMSGLMRTTSRSESENHFFGQFTNSRITLVEFLSNFETALEAQRYKHKKNDLHTMNTTPDWLTDFVLEKQAHEIYTRNIFNDVQSEIQLAVHKTTCMNTQEFDDHFKFSIRDLEFQGSSLKEVTFNKEGTVITCTCGRYERYGLLCRHIFHVLRSSFIKVFPPNYVMKRWTRDAVPHTTSIELKNKQVVDAEVDAIQKVRREIMSSTEYIVERLGDDMEKLSFYSEKIKQQVSEVVQSCGVTQPVPKKDVISRVYGFDQPSEVNYSNPVGIRTKGCGSKKRFKPIEELITKVPRRPRSCTGCGSIEHDVRTCSTKKSARIEQTGKE